MRPWSANPRWVTSFDDFPLDSVEVKASLFAQAADEGWTIVLSHEAEQPDRPAGARPRPLPLRAGVTERVLAARELNRAMLARQHLLERVRRPIPDVLDDIAGIQNQYAPNAYLRLWSMIEGFERDELTRAYEAGTVVQGTLLRGTIHTVSAGDYRPWIAAIRPTLAEWAESAYREPLGDRDALVRRIRGVLGGRSVTRAEFQKLLEGVSRSAAGMSHLDAEVLRVPPQGTWAQRRAHLFGLAEDWIGPGEPPSEPEGIDHLVRRYLGGFGPAGQADIQAFTGLSAARLRPVLAAGDLVRYRDEAGKMLVDVLDGVLPDPDTPAPPQFLPTWDAMLLVHARRTAILDEPYRKVIFATKMPPSYPTLLVDGRVVGTWKHADGRIVVDAFEPIARTAKRAVDEEAERLAAFHA